MKKLFLYLIIIGNIFSCSSDDMNQTQTINLRINHYQNTGIAKGLFLILLVQEGDDIGADKWNKFYSKIEGFNFEPGYVYNLSVIVERIDNPSADGSSLKYTVKEIKSTQKVDNETPFDIDLKINGQNFVTTTSGYRILNQIEVDCNTPCNELDERI